MKQADRDMIIEMHTDVKAIKFEINGNGKKGILARIARVEYLVAIAIGALIILSGASWGGLI